MPTASSEAAPTLLPASAPLLLCLPLVLAPAPSAAAAAAVAALPLAAGSAGKTGDEAAHVAASAGGGPSCGGCASGAAAAFGRPAQVTFAAKSRHPPANEIWTMLLNSHVMERCLDDHPKVQCRSQMCFGTHLQSCAAPAAVAAAVILLPAAAPAAHLQRQTAERGIQDESTLTLQPAG